MKTRTKFESEKYVVTAGVSNLIKEDESFDRFVRLSLCKHLLGKWGDMDEDDKKLNDEALEAGEGRIMSAYTFHKDMYDEKKIWIITEADRSVTTILFPEEY